jgi:hypothetical protein
MERRPSWLAANGSKIMKAPASEKTWFMTVSSDLPR